MKRRLMAFFLVAMLLPGCKAVKESLQELEEKAMVEPINLLTGEHW